MYYTFISFILSSIGTNSGTPICVCNLTCWIAQMYLITNDCCITKDNFIRISFYSGERCLNFNQVQTQLYVGFIQKNFLLGQLPVSALLVAGGVLLWLCRCTPDTVKDLTLQGNLELNSICKFSCEICYFEMENSYIQQNIPDIFPRAKLILFSE